MNINIHSLNTAYNKTHIQPVKYAESYNTIFSGKEKLAASLIGGTAGYLSVCLNKNDLMLKNCIKSKSKDDFETYKNNVIEYFKKNEYQKYDRADEDILNYLENTKNLEDLNFEIEMYLCRMIDEMQEKEINIFYKDINKKEKNKCINEIETKIGNIATPILKLLQKENNNPEVIKIKNELEKKYGREFLYLNNDVEFANALKEAFKILETNKIPLKQIDSIISYDNDINITGLCISTDKGKTVIINPNDWQIDNLVHTILHEILHSLQPVDISFRTQKIPVEYDETVENISKYSSIRKDFAHEVHCELYVKKLREGLNPMEEKLFNYLGGTFL